MGYGELFVAGEVTQGSVSEARRLNGRRLTKMNQVMFKLVKLTFGPEVGTVGSVENKRQSADGSS